ncbi:MAG: hypothetical protein QXV32_02250 [Conexivisphaerales archaeon]
MDSELERRLAEVEAVIAKLRKYLEDQTWILAFYTLGRGSRKGRG